LPIVPLRVADDRWNSRGYRERCLRTANGAPIYPRIFRKKGAPPWGWGVGFSAAPAALRCAASLLLRPPPSEAGEERAEGAPLSFGGSRSSAQAAVEPAAAVGERTARARTAGPSTRTAKLLHSSHHVRDDSAVVKPADPRELGAKDIPIEFLRGKEEPGGEELEPSKPDGTSSDRDHAARQPRKVETRATLTKGERLFLAGLVVLAVTGGALYLFRKDIATQYELRVHPEHYWASEVKSRRLSVKLAELQHQECMVDLLAARMKESISVARNELLGVNSIESRAHLASTETR